MADKGVALRYIKLLTRLRLRHRSVRTWTTWLTATLVLRFSPLEPSSSVRHEAGSLAGQRLLESQQVMECG